MGHDDENLLLIDTRESVDAANQEFYAKFPYPWPPTTFPHLDDADFEAIMLNQSVGDFSHRTVPADGHIWVAGCGTNQAVYTALRFPRATVVGSDLSPTSLDICQRTSAALGIANLTLRQESFNTVRYHEEFDFIVSTGVIHHNAEPARVLANLARALRPGGVLELMVYNRFHRTRTSAFQKAVRTVSRQGGRETTYDEELAIARALLATDGLAGREEMQWLRHASASEVADTLIQPLEYSYTVESLNALAEACGLSVRLPCWNQFDKSENRTWAVRSATADLQRRMDALPDVVRWQIVNLLFTDRSPMLWFFLTRRDHTTDDRYERCVNDDFLDRTFVRAGTTLRNFVLQEAESCYRLAGAAVPYPPVRVGARIRDIVEQADSTRPMRAILDDIGIDTASQPDVTDIRTQTTTSMCPYLKAM